MDIPEAIQAHKRSAWKPMIQEGDGSLTSSKFSGKPWLIKGEHWPQCRKCHKPLQFFLQINLDELPKQLNRDFGTGLLQMFYCTNATPLCEVDSEAFYPFSPAHLIRLVQPEGQAEDIEVPVTEYDFSPKTIVGWEEMDDYPNSEEGSDLDIELTDEEWDELSDQESPKSGDKLGGWPMWVQGVEYPNCPKCSASMWLVFQLDSEDNLPYIFGDMGCGHITQCAEHKDQLAFGWACS